MTRKDATTGGLSPATAHAEAGRAHRRHAEVVATGVLVTLTLLIVTGWWMAPGESGNAVGPLSSAPIPPRGDATLTYTAVTAPNVSGAVTALILGFMIAGAAMIGVFFFSPEIRRRPRRSGAVVVNDLLCKADDLVREAYSSIAPGAVFETVIRNSMLLLVFFNRSTIRSIA
ncbi:hypothetical protein ACFXHA_42325 [Nocardia sp. NPDC059240]|uniref:hypothetical protein n=1 Tax=Nocardia sp. NPDC059240 TaxID=3346786 RepID=UPI0036D10306